MKESSEKFLHTIFDAGILIKMIDSVGEVILGFLFLLVSGDTMNRIVHGIFGDELNEGPLKALWDFTLHSFAQLANNSQAFLAFIFLSHGAVKLILVAGLIKNKLWVYPLAAVAFTVFGLYQTYQIIMAPSIFLIILTVFDALFVGLIIHEYRYRTKKIPG